jgi:hypothetical protein
LGFLKFAQTLAPTGGGCIVAGMKAVLMAMVLGSEMENPNQN